MTRVHIISLALIVIIGLTCGSTATFGSASGTRDFVVSGTGTGGATACEYLSRDPSNTVMCIDIGRDHSDFLSTTPGFWGALPPAEVPWIQHVHTEERTMGARDLYTAYSKVLGGGSATNGNLHMRPSRKDFDHFGSSLWTYDALLPTMKALETSYDDVDPVHRGTDGPIGITTPAPGGVLSPILAGLSAVLGQPPNPAPAHGTPYGVGVWDRNVAYEPISGEVSAKRSVDDMDMTTRHIPINAELQAILDAQTAAYLANQTANGEESAKRAVPGPPGTTAVRQDVWTKILKPHLGRPNLDVVDQANVIRVIPRVGGKWTVIYLKDDTVQRVRVRKELVVAHGVLNTPPLLQRSGIGNCADLEAVGIECLIDVPELGYNLADSILTSQLYLSIVPGAGMDDIGSIGGVLYGTPGYDYVNMQTAAGVFPNVIPSGIPGVGYPAILMQMAQLVHSGRGKVGVQSSNPFDPEQITFNIYQNATEIDALVYHFKKIREVMGLFKITVPGLPFPFSIFQEISPGPNVLAADATDAEIAAYLQSKVIPEIHGIGTAAMGKVVDERGRVLDSDGRIVQGLRVADNSIIPELLETHSNSNTGIIIGRRVAELIAEEYGLDVSI